MAYNTQEMSNIPCLKQNRPDRTYRDTLNFVAHEPSAESTVNKNNTIFPITE